MMRLSVNDRLTRGLIAAAIALAVIVAVQLGLPAVPDGEPPVDSGMADESLPDFATNQFRPPSQTELSEMLDRPLFFPDRRLPQVAAPAETPRTPLRLRLEGIAIMADSRVAVLRNTANNQLLQLAEGMSHDGWTLDSIESDSARFVRGPEVTELPLETGANLRR